MITAEEFASRWAPPAEDAFVKFNEQQINDYSISKTTKDFLLVSGLPASAAPFISFGVPEEGCRICIDELGYGALFKFEKFEKYIKIGFTGDGSLICIDETNENIVYLDHEDDNREVFINSSLAQLMESILEYADFIKKIKEQNGSRAYLERNAPPETLDYIIHKLESIDCNALLEGSFWADEIYFWQCTD